MTENCCPECESLDILPLIARYDGEKAGQYRCDRCGVHFDEPDERERRDVIDPEECHTGTVQALLDADPSEVPSHD